MEIWQVTVLVLVEAAVLLAAVGCGAWLRAPFPIFKRVNKSQKERDVLFDERLKQINGIMNYSVDDARRAAREEARL